MKKYISDIITRDEINEKWKVGQKILITSQTGSGKSYFVKNTIYEYCKDNGYKCLLFSNRDLLKRQYVEGLESKMDVFKVENYQNMEKKVIGGISLENIYDGFDVIVFDEVHYLISDSSYNRNTDTLLKSLKIEYPEKILLFMTATPQMLLPYHNSFFPKYSLGNDYSYINSLSFYTKESSIEAILQNLEFDEKAIYFANKTEDAYEMSEKFEDSSFICSESSPYFGKKRNEETMREIALTESFSCKILCTTKVLDNGVNIVDPEVRTIIIETSDPITFIQEIGRKRIVDSSDKINLYVRDLHGGILYQKMKECNNNLNEVRHLEEVGGDEFEKEYRKRDFPKIIDNDKTVNIAKYYYFKYLLHVYLKMKKKKDGGFREYISEIIKFDQSKIRFADNESKIGTLRDVVEDFAGRKLFKEEQMELRRRFHLGYYPKSNGKRNFSIHGINGIMKDENIPYVIDSRRETLKENRKQTYWFIHYMEVEG